MPRLRNYLIRLRGGEPLPAGVALPLERGERVLTWARIRGGALAAATDAGLRVAGPERTPVLHRWHEIDRAVWDDETLTVERADRSQAAYRLTEPRGVPAAVREHVNASVVVSVRHEVAPGLGIRVVARRDLSTGRVAWSARPDDALDPDDPQVQEQATALVERVRRNWARQQGEQA